ncbi:MAG: YdcF family protein [Rhodanobacter sp.]
MLLSLIAALTLLACLALWRRWRRLAGTFAVLAALLLVLAGSGLLPRLLLQQLQAPYAQRPAQAWAPHNAIVLLTGGSIRVPHDGVEPGISAYGRIAEAAVLYHACHQAGVGCKLLVSGGDPQRRGTALAVSYARVLRGLGVPGEDLVLEPRSNNTWQNAQFSRPLLAKLDAPKVWLVSSAWHLRRSVLYFDHFGIASTPVRADYLHADLGLWPSAQNLVLTDVALHEYLGVLRYHVYNAMGWNAPAMKPVR